MYATQCPVMIIKYNKLFSNPSIQKEDRCMTRAFWHLTRICLHLTNKCDLGLLPTYLGLVHYTPFKMNKYTKPFENPSIQTEDTDWTPSVTLTFERRSLDLHAKQRPVIVIKYTKIFAWERYKPNKTAQIIAHTHACKYTNSQKPWPSEADRKRARHKCHFKLTMPLN